MFTGIIKNMGCINNIDFCKDNIVEIKSNFKGMFKLGESISCSGICLTVFKSKGKVFWVNASSETQDKTNMNLWKIGDFINLEKSLKVGDDLGGHLVFGHVDGICKVLKITKIKDSRRLDLEIDKKISKFLTPKCSISLDGISLTVNKVEDNNFSVNIIPYTWDNTSLVNIKKGDILNTEIDMLARYTFAALKK